MARLKHGLLGPLSGTIGPVITAHWKGQPYLRSRPRKRSKKRRVGEKRNQDKFAQAHYWLKPLLDFVRVGFRGYAEKMEGFNAAKSFCLKNAFVGEPGKQKIDPSMVQVSYGDLPLPSNIKMKRSGDNLLQFTWDKKDDGGNRYDQVMLLAYDCNSGQYSMRLPGQFRSTGSDELKLFSQKKQNYHVYIAFLAHDRNSQSNSVYLGEVST